MRVVLIPLFAVWTSIIFPAPTMALDAGRSVSGDPSLTFDDCRPLDEVCAIMPPGSYMPFDDRCAARSAGARRILFGRCDDED